MVKLKEVACADSRVANTPPVTLSLGTPLPLRRRVVASQVHDTL
jgi:hypothetical protein